MATLQGTVAKAGRGVLGFDTNTPLTSTTAASMFDAGYRFCARYVPHAPGVPGGSDLTPTEARLILAAGLALMAVQHVRVAGWTPSHALGQADGKAAADNAATIGLPPGVCVWCDLEGVAGGTSAADVIAHCNAWHDAVASAGYVPGLYVGGASVLTGDQLRNDLKMAHYWRSQSDVPDVAVRGYQLLQGFPSLTVGGLSIDQDWAEADRLGGTAIWLAPSS